MFSSAPSERVRPLFAGENAAGSERLKLQQTSFETANSSLTLWGRSAIVGDVIDGPNLPPGVYTMQVVPATAGEVLIELYTPEPTQ